jgi:peptide/nickel transport system substrate-binding protein
MSQRHRTSDDSSSIDPRTGLTRRQWLAGAGAAAGVGLGAVGGRRAAFAQGTPKRGGTLRVATVDKPVNMDPGFAQLYSSLQVYQNVYNKLVYVDEAGQFVPGLAKSWKQENDRTWLFDLVDNAVFHNGEPFSSKDVVFTFTRLLDAKNKLPMRIFFTPVEGVEASARTRCASRCPSRSGRCWPCSRRRRRS